MRSTQARQQFLLHTVVVGMLVSACGDTSAPVSEAGVVDVTAPPHADVLMTPDAPPPPIFRDEDINLLDALHSNNWQRPSDSFWSRSSLFGSAMLAWAVPDWAHSKNPCPWGHTIYYDNLRFPETSREFRARSAHLVIGVGRLWETSDSLDFYVRTNGHVTSHMINRRVGEVFSVALPEIQADTDFSVGFDLHLNCPAHSSEVWLTSIYLVMHYE